MRDDDEYAIATDAPAIELEIAATEPDIEDAGEYPHTLKELNDMLEDGRQHWSEPHKKYSDMLAFSHGEPEKQWDSEALGLRKESKRVALQYPIISAFIRPTVNSVSEAPPEISVFPISNATKDDAMLVSGLFRYIQTRAQAQRAYLYALDRAMRATISGFRITPKKVRRQIVIEITPIVDMTRIFIDPACNAMDYSDAAWVIEEKVLSERDYKRDFPDGTQSAVDGRVTVYEAWIVEDLPEDETDLDGFDDEDSASAAVKIHAYIFEPLKILDYIGNYEGTIIPFFFLAGERVDVNGKTTLRCVTDDLVAPQRAINWLESESVAVMASAPKALWTSPDDALGDFQDDWENSAVNPPAVLFHKAGSQPQPIEPPPPPAGYQELSQANIERARMITGIYPDPTLQAKADAPSGVAIKQQQMGSGIAMYHWVSALNNLMARAGECLLELAVKYLNDDSLRISLSADGTPSPVSFGPTDVPGVKNLDLSKLKLGCTFSAGPSYASQREALLDRIMEISAKQPQVLSVLIDWVVSQANLPGSEEVVDRLRATLPPNIQQIIQQHGQGDPKVVMASMRNTIGQLTQKSSAMQQMLSQVTEALKAKTAEVEQLKHDYQTAHQTKLEVAAMDNTTRLQIAAERSRTELERAHLTTGANLMGKHLDHVAAAAQRADDEFSNPNEIEE